MKAILCLPVLAALMVMPAEAQMSSPPPPLMGQPSVHLYSVPGVISRLGIETFFSCTNTSSAPIRVGIEVFAAGVGLAANDPSASSLEIASAGTYVFGTGPALGLSSSDLGIYVASFSGWARILATGKAGIMCTAFLADQTTSPPASMVGLPVIKKTKQRGT
jgi:hypothetical protein